MNNKYKILVIEDEENILNIITNLIKTNGYQVITAKSCENGFMMYASYRPDLIILDLGLPDGDGITFLNKLRQDYSTPVIILSARTDENDKVKALDSGANDYITKPFGSQELMARIRTALRLSVSSGPELKGKFQNDGLIINYDSRQVFLDNKEIKFTQTEFNIISLLSLNAGKVLTYAYIIRQIWGYNDLGSTKKLQVNMANIRKKIGEKPGKKNYIANELGVGYRMNDN